MKAKSPLSRRQMLATMPAAAAAMTGGAATAEAAADDPVFAAIEIHRQAVQRWRAAPGKTHEDDKIAMLLLAVERDAWREWLTTPPTTLAGILATVEHAAYPPNPDYTDDHVYTNLAETGEYCPFAGNGDPTDALAAGERFPAMIATALRQIMAEKML